MKFSRGPIDPILRSLADDAADLPRQAAAAARRFRERRSRLRRTVACAVTVMILLAAGWHWLPSHSAMPQPPGPLSVVVTTPEDRTESAEPSLPAGLTVEQEAVVTAVRGHPVVLVRDRDGSVARIHVISR